MKSWKSLGCMTSLNLSGLIQKALYFSAAPTSTIICIDFMSEISESCIDLCFILHTGLNFVIGQGMGGKNVRTAWKVYILNNWKSDLQSWNNMIFPRMYSLF